MKKINFSGIIMIIFIISSCENFSLQNVKDTPEYKKLLKENDSLKKVLDPNYENQETEMANSEAVLYNDNISIVKIETGFDPYKQNNLWLPCIAIKFKNISNNDINDFLKVSTIFINNSTNEQIGSDVDFLTSRSDILTSGTTKQLKFHASIGWYGISSQDITAKIYFEGELIKTLKVDVREFDGLIRE